MKCYQKLRTGLKPVPFCLHHKDSISAKIKTSQAGQRYIPTHELKLQAVKIDSIFRLLGISQALKPTGLY